ncbi:nicotinate-nucleotide adenylyltransferase [Candidatus Mycoplasma pogonae]
MKIAIYGGSFNPVHKGHVAVANDAIEYLGLDKLYFVPNYQNPFKKGLQYVSSQHRIAMLKLVQPPKTVISEFETNRKNVSYTIDTVEYFKQKFPKAELYLIIGSDNLPKLNKWKKIEQISQIAKIVVFRRSKTINKINLKKFKCELLNNKIYDFSSTEFVHGKLEVADLAVRHYIGQHFLYAGEMLKNAVDAKRHKHCLATGDLAAEYAKHLKYDARDAFFAGMMHDLTKNMPYDVQRDFLAKHGYDQGQYRNYQLHQTTAAVWLEKEYFLPKPEIIHAISIHTSLALELKSDLDKIVFMADKLARGRKFPGIQKVRELAFQNFEAAFKTVVQYVWDENKAAGIEITPEQEAIYLKWINHK